MFDTLLNDFSALLSFEWILSLFHIIMIDVVLSGDNAIVIWMATKKLTWKSRKKAIILGIAWATSLRILFAFGAVYLLKIIGIQIAGAFLLLYVVWKFYTELRSEQHEEMHERKEASEKLIDAIKLIIIADISMSLDNVLAVAWAAKENVVALWLGLIVSIALMAFASNFIAKKMNQFPQIQWIWLLIILLVSIEMLLTWFEKLDTTLHIGAINFIGVIFFLIFLFAYGKIKNMKLPEVHFLQKWKYGNIFFIPFTIWIVLISILSFLQIIQIHKNIHILYTVLVLTIILWIEYLWTIRKSKSKTNL